MKQLTKITNVKAQALLVLTIYLAIALILVTSASFSALKSSEVVRRNINFQTSFDRAEHLIDLTSKQIDTGTLHAFPASVPLNEGPALVGNAIVTFSNNEYIDLPKDAAINVDVKDQTNGATLTASAVAVLKCKSTGGMSALELTFVYDTGSEIKSDKKIFVCDTTIASFPTLSGLANGANTMSVVDSEMNKSITGISVYNKLLLVRIKNIRPTSGLTSVKLEIKQSPDASIIAGTSKYVILSSGLMEDGSASSTIKVEKPAGFYTPPQFDYVFFQGS
jgi:hypothetical protein